MADGEVRLRYSGLVLFLSRLISVGTGLLFSLMVTRSISAEEFGLYGNITDVLSYFTLVAGIFPFWAARFSARKHQGSEVTGLAANLLIGLPSSLVYLLAVPGIMIGLQISQAYLAIYFVVAAEIVEVYLLSSFEATLQVKRPQMLGFGFLIFELCKVFSGFFLIVQLKRGLLGVIVSVVLAYIFQILFYLRSTFSEIHEKIRWDYIKVWLRASLLSFYSIVGQRLVAVVNIFLFVYGGELSRAYYGAAITVAGIIGYSSFLAYALYPRLLSETRPEDASVSLKMVLMFAIPMTIGTMILSDSFLVILNPLYVIAKFALILSSLYILCLTLLSIFDAIVSGTEKLDAEAKIRYSNMLRSRLFFSVTLSYAQAAVSLPLTYLVLTSVVEDAVEAATAFALINLLASMAITMAKYAIARRCLAFSVPWGSIGKYLAASLVMALVLSLLPTPTRISTTLAATLLGGSVYFLLLSALDKESREIAKSVIQELRKILEIPSGKGS